MKIFVLTFFGVFIPVMFIGALGAVLMTVPAYADAYRAGDVAGVLKKGVSFFCYLCKN
jgi:purine-cytosine permease-like protein